MLGVSRVSEVWKEVTPPGAGLVLATAAAAGYHAVGIEIVATDKALDSIA